jgi:3-hydroxyanthranilate 3,4-dioxygenase
MIVAGPNARKDYHYNETEELFYQLEGSIKVIIQEDGIQRDGTQRRRYLHPAKVPHSPVRSEALLALLLNANVLLKAMLMDYCGSVITVTINCMKFILNSTISKRFLASF